MREAEEIDRPLAIFEQGLQRGFRAVVGEVAKEGVAGAERKKAEGDARFGAGVSEDAIENFVSGAVAADGDEATVTLIIGLAGKLRGVTWSGRGENVDAEAFFAQACDGRACELRRAAAARSGVDDGEEAVLHKRAGLPTPTLRKKG